MARDESSKALTDGIQKNGSLTYDLHLFSANQKSSHKVLTDSTKFVTLQIRSKCDNIQLTTSPDVFVVSPIVLTEQCVIREPGFSGGVHASFT